MLCFLLFNSMFSLLKKYELRGAKRRVRLFNRFQIESVLKIAPYHTLKFGCIGKLAYLCTVVQRKAIINHKFKAFALTGRQGCAPQSQHSTFNTINSTFNIKIKIMKVNTWKTILQIAISVLTAIATTLGVTSCSL